jgi:hypothetical protein
MSNLFDKLQQLNGKELRDLLKNAAEVKNERVTISGPVSKDYEKYQLKNHPNTVDVGVTVVMGAPFSIEFCNNLEILLEKLKRVFEDYNVILHTYAVPHIHATVSPIIRTKFIPDSYRDDPDTMNKNQRREIQDRALNPQEVKMEVCSTKPFNVEVYPWDIKIGGRGELLLWGTAKNDEGRKELKKLRKRLRGIAGDDGRDKGFKVHMALATIEGFHKLTGIQKKEIADKINSELELIPVPDSVHIDRVKLVQYLHRSLSNVESSEEIHFR